MVALRVNTFVGMIPVREPRLLPEQAATLAVNLRTDSGALEGITSPRFIKNLTAGTKRVYRIPYTALNVAVPITDLDNSTWLEYADLDTDVVRTPTVNDSFDRYYWCSPSTGFRYASRAQLLAGGDGYVTGVRAPATAPNVTPVDGTGELDEEGENTAPAVTRSYVVTWVSEFGEESAPSPPAEAAGFTDQQWSITSIPLPSAVADQPNITSMRLYRTVTSASGVTTFFLVTTLTISTSVYLDELSDTIVTGANQLESTNWATPPEMDGIIAMPNGIFVGWKGSTLYFAENYRPHAWPVEYAITVQHPIVGLGVFGNTCVVCTTGAPAAVSGVKANAMNYVQSNVAAPCLSRAGIVSAAEGVYFPSDAGLILFGPAGMQNVTAEFISRNQWQTDFLPTTLRATYLRGQYIALRGADGERDAFMMAPFVQNPASNGVVNADVFTDAVTMAPDPWSGRSWLIDNDKLYEWEPAGGTPATVTWRTKEVHLPRPGNIGAAQVFFAEPTLSDEEAVTLRVYADDRLIYEEFVRRPGAELRLPSGFKATMWLFEIEAKVKVQSLHVASTLTELRNV